MKKTPLFMGLAGLAATGEAQNRTKSVSAPESKNTTQTPSETAGASAEADPLPFKVKVNVSNAEAGKGTSSVIEASPAPGFKMNVEFPSSFVPDNTKSVTFVKPKLSMADAKIDEKAISFSPAYTVTQSGPTRLSGKISISVCNERACKLYRNHPVEWSVNVK